MKSMTNLAGKNKMINKTFLLCTILLSLLAGTLAAEETYEVRSFFNFLVTLFL